MESEKNVQKSAKKETGEKGKLFCQSCGREIEVEKDEIKNGKLLCYKDSDGNKIKVIKCNDCFSKNKSLENYKKCEVYSRVVGYLRPVQQWNIGKKEEYKERNEHIV